MNYHLRNAKIQAGYTQKELAKKARIKGGYMVILHYERLRKFPSLRNAAKITKVLKKPNIL